MEKDILKKDFKNINKKDKVIIYVAIAIFLIAIIAGIILIINKNDKDTLDRINKNNKNKVEEKWSNDKEIIEFSKEKGAKYYEYCVSLTEDNKECLWSRTEQTSIEISTSGHKYVYYKVIGSNDKVIKEELKEVFVDNSAPIINDVELLEEEKVTIRIDAVDNVSSIDKYQYSLDGTEYTDGTMTKVFEDVTKGSNQVIYVRVIDKAGNSADASIKLSETPEVAFPKKINTEEKKVEVEQQEVEETPVVE